MRAKVSNLAILLFAIVVCHTIFSLCGLYRSRRLSGRKHEALDLLRATTAFLAFFLALSYVFHIRMVTMDFLVEFWALSTVPAGRHSLCFAPCGGPGPNRRAAICVVCSSWAPTRGRSSSRAASQPAANADIACSDSLMTSGPASTLSGPPAYELVSDCAGLDEYLRRNVVDEVAIYLPLALLLQAFVAYGRPVPAARHHHAHQFRLLSSSKPRAGSRKSSRAICTWPHTLIRASFGRAH